MPMYHKLEAAARLVAANGPKNVITQPLMRLEVWSVVRIILYFLTFDFICVWSVDSFIEMLGF